MPPANMWRGSMAHEGFQAFYERRAADWLHDKMGEVNAFLMNVPSDLREGYEQEAANALECVSRYAKWAMANDDFTVEKSHATHVVDLAEYGLTGNFQIEVDGIVRRADKLWLLEYKTCKRPLNEDIVEIDMQLTAYLHFLAKALKEPVIGAIYTQIPTSVLKTGTYAGKEVVRYYLHRTEEQQYNFMCETLDQVHDMLNAPRIYRDPRMECGWDCIYYELCRLESQGGDVAAIRESEFERKEPTA